MSNKENNTESQDPRSEEQSQLNHEDSSSKGSAETSSHDEQAAADSVFDEPTLDGDSDSSSKESSTKEASSAKTSKGSNGSSSKPIKWFIFLILVAAIAYAVFFGWQKWQDYQSTMNKADRIDQIEQQISMQQHSLETKMSKQTDLIRDLSSDLEQNQRYINQLQEQLRTTQRKFQTLSSEKQQDWLFNEAEYLIREASYKLNFTDDAASIIALLQAADNQLSELNDGSLTQIRQAISQDINAVRGSGNLDIEGVAIAIETLKSNLSQLELASVQLDKTSTEAEDNNSQVEVSSWQHFKNSMSHAASKYYTVHQFDESTQPFISPQKDRLLRENILLNLQTAQLATLQNNQPLYESNLGNVKQWVEQYFKQKPATTQAYLTQLEELLDRSVELDLPASLQSYQLISDISQQKVKQWLESDSPTTEEPETTDSEDTDNNASIEEEPSA